MKTKKGQSNSHDVLTDYISRDIVYHRKVKGGDSLAKL